MRRLALSFLAVCVVICPSACAGPRFQSGEYRDGPIAFHLGDLGADWSQVSSSGGIAFHHRDGGTMFAGAGCDHEDDVPLDVLTNHLLFGIDNQQELSRQPITLDGRAALRTRVDGVLDGVPVSLDLVVLKKDDCTYDLHLVTGRDSYAARRPDFDRFIAGFAQSPAANPAR